MKFTQDEAVQFLKEMHMTEDAIDKCRELLTQENYAEMYRYLRSMRPDFLEEMHESQKRLDLLDHLLYDIKKKTESATSENAKPASNPAQQNNEGAKI